MFNFLKRVSEVQNGMATMAFAKKLGMNQKTVDLYVKGERKPSVEFVRNICSTFGVSADWLLGLQNKSSTAVELSESPPSEAAPETAAVARVDGASIGRDCLECPLLQAHLKRFSRPRK